LGFIVQSKDVQLSVRPSGIRTHWSSIECSNGSAYGWPTGPPEPARTQVRDRVAPLQTAPRGRAVHRRPRLACAPTAERRRWPAEANRSRRATAGGARRRAASKLPEGDPRAENGGDGGAASYVTFENMQPINCDPLRTILSLQFPRFHEIGNEIIIGKRISSRYYR
jgi:hypothetical protein